LQHPFPREALATPHWVGADIKLPQRRNAFKGANLLRFFDEIALNVQNAQRLVSTDVGEVLYVIKGGVQFLQCAQDGNPAEVLQGATA
jgi:hypothetical protein